MVYGIVQLINFAHGEIFMIGAFGALVHLAGPRRRARPALLLLPFMLVGGIVVAVGVALLTERFAYRPLRNAPRLAPLITAIGVSIFLQEVGPAVLRPDPRLPRRQARRSRSRRSTTSPVRPFSIGGADASSGRRCSPWSRWRSARSSCIFFVNRTRLGRAMQATSQDPDTARLMGINVDRIIMVAFALGAALAAVAGLAYGLRYTNIDFKMGFLAGLKAFTAAVLGGIGNINGAVVGGLVLGVVEVLATTYIPGQFGGSAWKDVWAFVLLILVLVFRPQGLLGARVVDRA